MKTFSTLILAVFLIGLVSCSKEVTEINAIEKAPNISEFQQFMLNEINFVRTNPVGYAELRLKSLNMNATDNGSYLHLKNSTPVGTITFNESLNLAASDYATFLAINNILTHTGDGTPLIRAIRAGFSGSATGENIAAASDNSYNAKSNPQSAAIGFVRLLIIDEGIADLGHRLVILNSRYKTIGIGFTQNSLTPFLNYVVQDFGNQ